MKRFLISPGKNQYKANLHCHSTLSDGNRTPEELKAMYKEHGYDILAITDHCHPKSHASLSDRDFLMLTGYEAYIRESGGKFDKFKREIHLNLFAKNPYDETLVCYDKRYIKYIPENELLRMKKVGDAAPREYSVEYINKFIKTARDNGYLVAYNHPYWSLEDVADILSYENLWSIELRNTGSYIFNNLENGEMLYDAMLRRGMRLGVNAGDDNHNKHFVGDPMCDSFGWYTVILADRLEYSEIISAMEKKDCYVSNGPEIKELLVEGSTAVLECSPAEAVFMYDGSKQPVTVRLPKGETRTRFELPIRDRAEHIRVSVYDAEGKAANSRGFFRDEWQSY